jgi:hypothetical protein
MKFNEIVTENLYSREEMRAADEADKVRRTKLYNQQIQQIQADADQIDIDLAAAEEALEQVQASGDKEALDKLLNQIDRLESSKRLIGGRYETARMARYSPYGRPSLTMFKQGR